MRLGLSHPVWTSNQLLGTQYDPEDITLERMEYKGTVLYIVLNV